jgi:hypothetical protein
MREYYCHVIADNVRALTRLLAVGLLCYTMRPGATPDYQQG